MLAGNKEQSKAVSKKYFFHPLLYLMDAQDLDTRKKPKGFFSPLFDSFSFKTENEKMPFISGFHMVLAKFSHGNTAEARVTAV